MNINEALQILSDSGYMCETVAPVSVQPDNNGPIFFDDIAKLQQACSSAAITKHEYAQYDEWDQEPWCDEDEIRNIPADKFIIAVDAEKFVGKELTQDEWDQLVYDWFSWLCSNDYMGWDNTWAR